MWHCHRCDKLSAPTRRHSLCPRCNFYEHASYVRPCMPHPLSQDPWAAKGRLQAWVDQVVARGGVQMSPLNWCAWGQTQGFREGNAAIYDQCMAEPVVHHFAGTGGFAEQVIEVYLQFAPPQLLQPLSSPGLAQTSSTSCCRSGATSRPRRPTPAVSTTARLPSHMLGCS